MLAVAELNRITLQNAAPVQEYSATTGNLSGQTTALGGAITRLRCWKKMATRLPQRPPRRSA